ncbi:adenosine deaminase [Microbacterium halimionae]|uniref:Adenosine deaminase n=1 Tax=Microbacterium halimionae TaxID=1526413 RepID=A0A7W3JQG0_9MICO|nr:adenosine deaminase [Microbacterium halimionae]MBA8817142.1 adenosine deaminase [Microbacterium halimionae]NII94592.1 adenosine deaminase [Microbacterium halimionae]
MPERTQSAPRIDEFDIRALPKAEVHIHLEGSFALIDILTLAKESGSALPGPASTIFDITTHGAYAAPEVTTGGGSGVGAGGLTGFLGFLDWQCGLVRTREQAARIAYSFAARQSSAGVRYSDVIVNPTHWNAWRGRELELMDAFAAGFDDAEQDGLCVTNMAYSLLRSQSAIEAEDIVGALVAARPRRVVALSVDGDEKVSGRTGEKFQNAFAAAASAGFHRTVHAGESSGPEGVWDAIDLLQAERIDHGVRAIEDPALIKTLIDREITLGVCPRSNVSLGIYRDWQSHPLPRLLDAGVAVTLNTDDPAPLGTTLDADWAVAATEFGFTYDDLAGFAERSIDASFANDDLKATLHSELQTTIAEHS